MNAAALAAAWFLGVGLLLALGNSHTTIHVGSAVEQQRWVTGEEVIRS